MRRFALRLTVLVTVCLVVAPVVVGDDAQSLTAARLAADTLAIVDVVVEQHIEAPPRQELVRQAIVAIRQVAKLDPPLGLGRRVSGINDSAGFRRLLTQECAQALSELASQQPPEDADRLLLHAIATILRATPGQNMITRAREHEVQEQLAANRYVGTGIALGGARDGKPPVMMKVFPDGPAAGVGARDGDVILEIDGTSTDGMPMVDVVRMLRGPGGSDVEVLLQQNDEEPRRYTITRGVVPIKHTHAGREMIDGKSIEVIQFDRLTSATVSDLRKIEQQWKVPPDAILLDLQIIGSDLHHAVLLADVLLDGGSIGRLERVSGSRDFDAGRDALFAGVPMFVLVSKSTAGTTEWIAAALQDTGRATIIGEQTAGRPYVSESFDVPGTDWVLTLASGVLERADGRRLLRTTPRAVTPSIAIATMQRAGDSEPVRRGKREHDGGVLPDHPVGVRGWTTPNEPGDHARVAPRINDHALPVIGRLLERNQSEHPEAE